MRSTISRFLKKSRAIIVKGPATARNIAFSRFDYWPVRRLRNTSVSNLPVYCVSLPASARRRAIIRRQVEGMGLTAFTFIDAFSAAGSRHDELDRALYDDLTARSFHSRSLTPSEIACSLSHGRTYDTIVACGHEIAMVVEDDCLFIPSRLERIDLDALPQGWDVAFLNSFIESGRPRRLVSGTLYKGDAYTGSSAAYLVSRKGAKRLAEGYKPVIHAADGYLGRNDLLRLMYYPDCVLNGSVCHYFDNTVRYLRG